MQPSRFGLSGVQLWPTMIFTRIWEDAEKENPVILNTIRVLQSQQRQAIDSGIAVSAKSGEGIYESNFDLLAIKDSGLERLSDFIKLTLTAAVFVANGQQEEQSRIVVQIVDSWYHITNQNGFHDAHVHHGCSWCGIYYVDVGTTGVKTNGGAPNGGSRFYCPFNTGGGYRDFGNKYLNAYIDPEVRSGMLLLFPSYLLHSGLPYVGEHDRVVIAFNARVFLKPLS